MFVIHSVCDATLLRNYQIDHLNPKNGKQHSSAESKSMLMAIHNELFDNQENHDQLIVKNGENYVKAFKNVFFQIYHVMTVFFSYFFFFLVNSHQA